MTEIPDSLMVEAMETIFRSKAKLEFDGTDQIEVFARDIAEAILAERERWLDALTPSAGTKSAYIGEFSFRFPVHDADGNDVMMTPNVPWTTIKEIMAAIRAYAEHDASAHPHSPTETDRSAQ